VDFSFGSDELFVSIRNTDIVAIEPGRGPEGTITLVEGVARVVGLLDLLEVVGLEKVVPSQRESMGEPIIGGDFSMEGVVSLGNEIKIP
jgi:hypothetical protein